MAEPGPRRGSASETREVTIDFLGGGEFSAKGIVQAKADVLL